MTGKDKIKWAAFISACAFLVVSTYIKYIKIVIYYAEEACFYMLLVEVAALATLVLGLLSLPRWQSFFALLTCGYALYWFSQPAYGIP